MALLDVERRRALALLALELRAARLLAAARVPPGRARARAPRSSASSSLSSSAKSRTSKSGGGSSTRSLAQRRAQPARALAGLRAARSAARRESGPRRASAARCRCAAARLVAVASWGGRCAAPAARRALAAALAARSRSRRRALASNSSARWPPPPVLRVAIGFLTGERHAPPPAPSRRAPPARPTTPCLRAEHLAQPRAHRRVLAPSAALSRSSSRTRSNDASPRPRARRPAVRGDARPSRAAPSRASSAPPVAAASASCSARRSRAIGLGAREQALVVDDDVRAHAHHDAPRAVRELERRDGLVGVLRDGRDARDDRRARVAAERVLEQPRELRVAVRHAGALRALRERGDHVAGAESERLMLTSSATCALLAAACASGDIFSEPARSTTYSLARCSATLGASSPPRAHAAARRARSWRRISTASWSRRGAAETSFMSVARARARRARATSEHLLGRADAELREPDTYTSAGGAAPRALRAPPAAARAAAAVRGSAATARTAAAPRRRRRRRAGLQLLVVDLQVRAWTE